jgi:sensor histidine kinase YesM
MGTQSCDGVATNGRARGGALGYSGRRDHDPMTWMRRLAVAQGGRRELAWLMVGLWSLGSFIMLVQALLGQALAVYPLALRALLMTAAGAAMSAVIWRIVFVRWESLGARVALLCASLMLVILLHAALDLATVALLDWWMGRAQVAVVVKFGNPAQAFFLRLFVSTNIILFAALHSCFGIAATALRSAIESREREQLLTEARAAAASAQLAMLRYQLNPHFVFNTLNAIGSLVESGRNVQAGTMIEKLSDFLRSSLNANDESFSTLEDELSTIHAYLDVESVRFGGRLDVQYVIGEAVGPALVPSFILQPLVENAIKHAVSPAMRKVTLRLSAQADEDELILTVEDDGAGGIMEPSVRARGAGIGLVNVRERLALLYGSKGTLASGRNGEGYTAVLRLPLSFTKPPVPA